MKRSATVKQKVKIIRFSRQTPVILLSKFDFLRVCGPLYIRIFGIYQVDLTYNKLESRWDETDQESTVSGELPDSFSSTSSALPGTCSLRCNDLLDNVSAVIKVQ